MTRSALLALVFVLQSAPTLAADSQHLRGKYSHGKQVSLFEPCGGEEAFWLLEEGESAAWLVRAHNELTTVAYEGVVAEISARRMPNDNVPGVPEEYDALLAVDAVYEVRPLPQPDCG